MISSSPELFNRIGRKQCTWLINLQGNTRIRLWFDALKMDGDVIFVRDGNDSSAPLLATVKDGFSSSILSKRNSMYIFYSHNGKWKNGTKRGFTASYRAEGGPCLLLCAAFVRVRVRVHVSMCVIECRKKG